MREGLTPTVGGSETGVRFALPSSWSDTATTDRGGITTDETPAAPKGYVLNTDPWGTW